MDNSATLNQLKNVHLPDSISIFPLAIGWYIIITIVIILIIFACIKLKQKKYNNQVKQIYALLAKIEADKTNRQLSEVSILIKRVAIMKFPKLNVHTMFGEKWLNFLDEVGKTNNFTNGDGRYLLDIYQNKPIENPEQFFVVVRQWLKAVL